MYTQEMLESIKKVEATRAERLANVKAGIHPRRMTAEEKVQVKMENHPDYIESQFAELGRMQTPLPVSREEPPPTATTPSTFSFLASAPASLIM